MDFSEDGSKGKRGQRQPRPAATVILARSFHDRIQVYLLKRSGKSRFFPGSYVFPGGALDQDDMDFSFWRDHIDVDMEDVSRLFGGDDMTGEDVLGYCVAGIRETFEEAGVLLASIKLKPFSEQACMARETRRLEKGWLRQLTSSVECILTLSALSVWSHWVTPELMKYHFDTLFFIAMMPQGQSCAPDGEETDDGIWISPKEALASNLTGKIPLSPPTIVTMHELLSYPDVDSLKEGWDARTWGKARRPRMIRSDSETVILEPWDPQYCDTAEDLDTTGFESLILSPCEPFSRIWLHNGIWKPIRAVYA